jgi:hypothetical protein
MSQAVVGLKARTVASPRGRRLIRRVLDHPAYTIRHPLRTFSWWRAASALATPARVEAMDESRFRAVVRDSGFEARTTAALAAHQAGDAASQRD